MAMADLVNDTYLKVLIYFEMVMKGITAVVSWEIMWW
jgi:hypothetical protein